MPRSPIFAGRRCLLTALLLLAAVWRSSAWADPSPIDRPLRLADCLALAYERQPALTVARSRLASAQIKAAALDAIGPAASLVRHDLAVRRQQARLGLDIARADMNRAESETRYAVTRAYLSVLYARQQRIVLDELIEDLRFLRQRIADAVAKKERPEWSEATVDLITLYLRRAEARRAEAERGVALSLSALREAMGMDLAFCPRVAEEPLPQPNVRVCREDIQAAALSIRGEAIQADAAAAVVGLEAEAQERTCGRGSVQTFAAAADLHARHVPQPIYGEEFRPGGVPLGMPITVIGPRSFRVEEAREYAGQAAAITEKTRNLIALEADEAYFSWQEWSSKVVLYREAEQVGERLARRIREEFRGSLKRMIESVVPESILAAQARSDYLEALYRQAIALAGLERVTGGAFHAGLETPPAP